jgi:hypothetical protein
MKTSVILSLLLLSVLVLNAYAKKGDNFVDPVTLELAGRGTAPLAGCLWKGQEGLVDAIASDSQALYCHKETSNEGDGGIGYITFSSQVSLVSGSYVHIEMMRGTDGTCSTSPRFTLEWADGSTTIILCVDMIPGYTVTSANGRQFEQRTGIITLSEDKTLNSILLEFTETKAFVFMDNLRVFIPSANIDKTFTSASDKSNGSGQASNNGNGNGNGNQTQ